MADVAFGFSPSEVPAGRSQRTLLRGFGWLMACSAFVFWRLGYLPLLDPDEAHYAQITREMMQAGEWVVPLLDGQPHIDKPVLFHWLQAMAFSLLGPSEFAARVPSAAAALITLATTYVFGRRVFGRETGERALLLLLTMPATLAVARIGIFDMLFTAFLFGALTCFTLGSQQDKRRLHYAGFLLAAGAVLTKGPAALLLLGLTAGLCLLHPTTRAATRRIPWLHGTGLVLLVAVPWFALMWHRFDGAFVEQYLLYNNLELFGKGLYRRRWYPFFYVRVFFTAFLPWSPLLIGYAIDLWRTRRQRPALLQGEVVLWLWVATVIGFFTISRFKLDTYIVPTAPAIALLVAHAWQRARADGDDARVTRWAFLLVAVGAVLAGAAIWVQLFSLQLPIPRSAALLPIALIAGGTLLALRLVRARLRPSAFARPFLVALMIGYATVMVLGFPVLERARPTPDLARWIVSSTTAHDQVAMYRLSRWKASLRFYAGRPIAMLDDDEQLRALMASSDRVFCVMRRREVDRLRADGLPLRIVYHRDAIVGTSGRGLRQQRWGSVVIVTQDR